MRPLTPIAGVSASANTIRRHIGRLFNGLFTSASARAGSVWPLGDHSTLFHCRPSDHCGRGRAPIGTVEATALRAGSMRERFPSSELTTHTAPAPAAKNPPSTPRRCADALLLPPPPSPRSRKAQAASLTSANSTTNTLLVPSPAVLRASEQRSAAHGYSPATARPGQRCQHNAETRADKCRPR
jgi:hypothetical protein